MTGPHVEIRGTAVDMRPIITVKETSQLVQLLQEKRSVLLALRYVWKVIK